MFIYCFDFQEKDKLQKQLKLFKESNINENKCWIFLIDNNSKFNFEGINKSKCVVTDRMTF